MVAFVFISLVIVLAALGVVVIRNPLYCALSLVTCLLGIASLYASLGAHFLAAAQIVVYGGAVVVLILFVLMLLNLKTEPLTRRDIVVQSASVASALGFVAISFPSITALFNLFPDARARYLGEARGGELVGSVEAMGRELFTTYLFPFEAASLLIMVALIGAVMIGKKRVS